MAAPALADILKDFGRAHTPPVSAIPAPARAERHALPARAEDEIVTAARIEHLLAEERARTEAETTQRLEREYQDALAAQREAHAEEMQEVLARSGADAAERMLQRLGGMEERIADLAGSVIARILGGMLGDDIRQRSIDALAEIIRQAMKDDEAIRIRITGPQFLFATLAEKLGDWSLHLEHIEAPGLDLTVDIDEKLFETRFSEWSSSLVEALS